MTTTRKTRTLKVQQVGMGLPYVHLSVAELGLWKGDFVAVSVVRGALQVKKTRAPKKPKPKARKAAPPAAQLTDEEWLSLVASEAARTAGGKEKKRARHSTATR